ncbi:MAG: hypothetical protein ACFNYI_06625 [Eubacterium sp.]
MEGINNRRNRRICIAVQLTGLIIFGISLGYILTSWIMYSLSLFEYGTAFFTLPLVNTLLAAVFAVAGLVIAWAASRPSKRKLPH